MPTRSMRSLITLRAYHQTDHISTSQCTSVRIGNMYVNTRVIGVYMYATETPLGKIIRWGAERRIMLNVVNSPSHAAPVVEA